MDIISGGLHREQKFSDDFNYKKVSQSTIARIEHQAENTSTIKGVDGDDLYQEDVRLIAKDGKLFYLPLSRKKGALKGPF